MQSQPGYRDLDDDTQTWRLTLARELDLRKRGYGRHRFAALASSAKADSFTAALNEVNVTRDPMTREFSRKLARQSNSDSSGTTRTYGFVYRPLAWLGLVYNNADNFVPQTPIDINERPMGPRLGQGTDVGVKLGCPRVTAEFAAPAFRLKPNRRTAFVPYILAGVEGGSVRTMFPTRRRAP